MSNPRIFPLHNPVGRICLASILTVAPNSVGQQGLELQNGGATDPYVEVPYHGTLVPQTGLTVEAWVTYDGSTLGSGFRWPTIVRHDVRANSESFVMRVDASNSGARVIKFAVRTTTGGFQQARYLFAPGEFKTWTHVAGTFDRNSIRLYVNGAQRGVFIFPRPTDVADASGGVLRIGNGDTVQPGHETWNGGIDEVRVWPYARTADEIASTMNLALSGVGGEVSTWNLDNGPTDSSGSNNGADLGTPTYKANSLQLVKTPWTATSFGTPTTGCLGTPRIGANSVARLGNAGFALNAIRGVRKNGSRVVVLLGIARLATPIAIGASVWVDPAASALIAGQVPYRGYARLALPIPNDVSLLTQKTYAQVGFAETACAVQPFATEGLEIEYVR